MAIVPLPLSQNVQARALLHHLLEHGDIVGRIQIDGRVFDPAKFLNAGRLLLVGVFDTPRVAKPGT